MRAREAKRVFASAALTLSLALAGCGAQGTSAPNPPDTAEQQITEATSTQADFVAKEAPVFRDKLTDETITLRFYPDMPHVAYVNVADFYKLLLPQGTMDAVMREDGTWLLTSHTGADEGSAMEHGKGGTAVVDTVAATLTSPDLPAFTNVMSLVQDGMDNVYLDGAPYVRVAGVDYSKPANPVTIDLDKYGIVPRGDDDGMWIPIQTLSSIFSNLHYHYISYNGETVYVNNDNHLPAMGARDPEFTKPILAEAERPDDMIQFDYAQLCLAFDVFYGKPACAPDTLKKDGLDAYLASLGDEGKAIKDALMSKSLYEYFHGLDGLFLTMIQDGHTAVNLITKGVLAYAANEGDVTVLEPYAALQQNKDDPINQLDAKATNDEKLLKRVRDRETRLQDRADAYGDETYLKKGDTAVIVFDSFNDIDYEGWRNYLDGKGERPSPTQPLPDVLKTGKPQNPDSLAIFLDGMERAAADPEVRNVVLDISNNGGGSLDVVMFMTSLIANHDTTTFQNVLTGQTVTERFDVDRNLDGAFDEQDGEVDYSGLNFAVLTSPASFSCGNILPSILKDEGVLIMGEQSGGGSCAVQKQVSGEGADYPMSSWMGRMVNNAGEEIDGGVPVDVDLLKRDGSKGYASFYDIDTLRQVMDEFYAQREGDLADAA